MRKGGVEWGRSRTQNGETGRVPRERELRFGSGSCITRRWGKFGGKKTGGRGGPEAGEPAPRGERGFQALGTPSLEWGCVMEDLGVPGSGIPYSGVKPGLPPRQRRVPRTPRRPPTLQAHRGRRQAANALAQGVQVHPPAALRPPGARGGRGSGGSGGRGGGGGRGGAGHRCQGRGGGRAGPGRAGRAAAAVPIEPGQGALAVILGAGLQGLGGLQGVGAERAEGLR